MDKDLFLEKYNQVCKMFTHLLAMDMTILSMLGMKDKDIDKLNKKIANQIEKAKQDEEGTKNDDNKK